MHSSADVFWALLDSIGVADMSLCDEQAEESISPSMSPMVSPRTQEFDGEFAGSGEVSFRETRSVASSVKSKRVPDKKGSAYFAYDPVKEMNQLQQVRRVAEDGGIWWSSQALKLKTFLQGERHLVKKRLAAKKPDSADKRDHKFIMRFFKDLNFSKCGIKFLDKSLSRFANLEELCLTANKLEVLENLPSSITVLNAYANSIRTIAPPSPALKVLHLGLGFNNLDNCQQLLPFRHSLQSLDLSFNDLSDFKACMSALQQFSQLKYLWLQGNPLCLNKHYRSAVVVRMPSLATLDGTPLKAENRASMPISKNPSKSEGPSTGKKSGKGKGQPDKKAAAAEEAKRLEEEKAAAKQREEQRKMELELQKLASTEEALVADVVIQCNLKEVANLPDPGAVLEPALPEGDQTAQLDKGGKVDAKGGAKGGKSGKKGAAAKAGGGTRGDWDEKEPGVYSKTVKEEEENAEGCATETEKEITTRFEHVIKYRLQDDMIYATDTFLYNSDNSPINLSSKRTITASPDSQWRDFFDLLGLDVLLYRRQITQTKTTLKVFPSPEEVDPESLAQTTRSKASAASASSKPKTPNKSTRSKGEPSADELGPEVTVTETEDVEDVLLGVAHLDTSKVTSSCKEAYTSWSATTSLQFQAADTSEWDPLRQRRLPGEAEKAKEAEPASQSGDDAPQPISISVEFHLNPLEKEPVEAAEEDPGLNKSGKLSKR